MSQAYQPLHHKYRPDRFDSLIGQEAIAATLKEALKSNKIAPAYLFSGPRGTGKTSSARILARSLNCLTATTPTINPCGQCDLCKSIANGTALDIIEIDAASNTGVENIRELIERSRFSPVQARWKVYVIDECHMLSTAAFNALLKTLEEPPSKVVFILATTDPERVLPTILSRCMRFDFRRIPLQVLKEHLSMISAKENIDINDEALLLIAQRSQGGLRDAESLLDQLSLLPPPINISAVWDLLGAIPEEQLLDLATSLIKRDPKVILSTCRDLIDQGKEPISILQGIASILRDLVLKKAAINYPELCNISPESHKKVEDLAKQVDLNSLLEWQASLKGSEQQLRHSMQPRLWLEVLLLGMLSRQKNDISKDSNHKDDKKLLHVNKSKESDSSNTSSYPPIINNIASKEEIKVEIKNNKDSKLNIKNLDLAWEKILSMLELPSTKMLLSQQAKLTNIKDDLIEISVASQWIGMIENRQSLIEEAVTKALNANKKVIFKSQTDNKIKENVGKQPNRINRNNLEINKNNIEVKNIKDSDKSDQTKGMTENKAEASEIQSIDKSARQLADFFNGKIIKPNEE